MRKEIVKVGRDKGIYHLLFEKLRGKVLAGKVIKVTAKETKDAILSPETTERIGHVYVYLYMFSGCLLSSVFCFCMCTLESYAIVL
jgi:hypothetical protein